MTFDPYTNRIPHGLLTDEEKAALHATGGPWEYVSPLYPEDWTKTTENVRYKEYTYRAVLPAVSPAVRVKPLVWEIASGPDAWCHDHHTAGAFGGAYQMAPDEDSAAGAWLLQWTQRPDDFCTIYGGPITKHEGPDAAQAAAQADYEARILAALTPNSVDGSQKADPVVKPALAEALAEAEVRSMAIREFCDKAGISATVEVSGLPDDVQRWRRDKAIDARRAALRQIGGEK